MEARDETSGTNCCCCCWRALFEESSAEQALVKNAIEVVEESITIEVTGIVIEENAELAVGANKINTARSIDEAWHSDNDDVSYDDYN